MWAEAQKTDLNEMLLWNLPENFVTENHKDFIISIYIYVYKSCWLIWIFQWQVQTYSHYLSEC